MKTILVMDPRDNVGNALEEIFKGDEAAYVINNAEHSLLAVEDIPFAFKVAVVPIMAQSDIVKYGEKIGRAARDIVPGECVHIHNIEGARGRGDSQRGGL